MTLFRVALPLCILIAAWGIVDPGSLAGAGSGLTARVFHSLDWFFLTSVTGFMLLCVWLGFGRYGALRLGGNEAEPEFSTASWLAMLFSAGIGSGLLFWGVAEPVTHYAHPPIGLGETADAARHAMLLTNFHWGLHAWAVYCVAALVLGYFGFRRGTPYLAGAPIRAGHKGRWVEPVARLADLIAVVAVAFGVAGALVFGTLQVQAGLNVTSGVPIGSNAVALTIMAVLTVAYLLSATTSLDKGIKWLSNINIALALGLMIFLLVAGPTSYLLRGFVNAIGDYASSLPGLTLHLYPYDGVGGWLESWTLTYFVWWIAWAPFVGIFIARISYGRTIRQFVVGVLVTPTVLTILWFAVFGGTALHEQTQGGGDMVRMVDENITVALFTLLQGLPIPQILSGVAVVLIFIFLVTSADSATFVLGMLTSQGSLNPPTRRKLAWGVVLAGISAGLLLSGSLAAIKALAIAGAIPFTFILILQIGALLRALPRDAAAARAAEEENEP